MAKPTALFPHLTVHGAITLGTHLLAAAEPIEERPAFLAAALMHIDDVVRELRGAVQYRSQLDTCRPSQQQRSRAEVEVSCALDAVKGAIRSYAVRVAVVVDDAVPETVSLAHTLIQPLVDWEQRDAQLTALATRIQLETEAERGDEQGADAGDALNTPNSIGARQAPTPARRRRITLRQAA